MMMSREEWADVIDTNLTGVFNATRASIITFLKQKSGNIVNISSVSGIHPMPGQANYAAAKAGVIGLTKALAQEVAAYNVRVNAVAPGFIETGMTGELSEKARDKALQEGAARTVRDARGSGPGSPVPAERQVRGTLRGRRSNSMEDWAFSRSWNRCDRDNRNRRCVAGRNGKDCILGRAVRGHRGISADNSLRRIAAGKRSLAAEISDFDPLPLAREKRAAGPRPQHPASVLRGQACARRLRDRR